MVRHMRCGQASPSSPAARRKVLETANQICVTIDADSTVITTDC